MKGSESKRKFSVDFRVLSILLLLSVVPLVIGTWWLFRSYEKTHFEAMGLHLSDAADMTFNYLSAYLQNQIIAIAGLAEVPVLREAVRKGNLDLTKNLEELRRAIPAAEARWPSLDPQSPELKAILDNPASDFLRRYVSVNKSYREVMITDFLGRLVAATGKTTDYYQADEDWWKQAYGDGRRGSVYIGDVSFDASAKSYSMEFAQPFVEAEQGVQGMIKVVVDAQDIHSLIGSMRAGPSASAMLIRAKGTVVSAPGYSTVGQGTFPDIGNILRAREKGKRYFISSSFTPVLYGLAQRNIQELYPHLDWIIVCSGPLQEVLGPPPQLLRYFYILVLAITVLTVASVLVLSRTISRPSVEEDLHLEKL